MKNFLNIALEKPSIKDMLVYTRAAEISGGFWSQTPPLSLTKNMTPYQYFGPHDIILPRLESFEAGHFISKLSLTWPT